MKTESRELSSLGPRQVKPFVMAAEDVADVFPELARLGVAGLNSLSAMDMFEGYRRAGRRAYYGMDDLQPTITTPSIATPIQFLQSWLPGFVNVITAARKIDEAVGISTMGDWEDEEIVQGVLEQLGTSIPYTDYGNVPLSSWNLNFAVRTIVRFEEGMRCGILEEARAAKVKVNSADNKREAATLALEIQRNNIGFYGFNGGDNATYGLLNDPGLPAATDFPATGSGGSSDWSEKTTLEIIADLILGMEALRVQSQDTIDPEKDPITIAVPMQEITYLKTPSNYGFSAEKWLLENYPKARVISLPQFYEAVGGVSVCYFYAESVNDTSTDDKRTFVQVVPAKFRLLGVQQMAKGYEEDYSNATAGIMLKRPYAVARYLY
jgi:hypothetical protein